MVRVAGTFPTDAEVERVAADCRKAVRKFALAAGASSAVPLPGADLAADALIAAAMLDEILRRFRLRQSDIATAGLEAKALLLRAAKEQGCRLVGKALTKRLLLRLAAGSAWSAAARRFGKYAPIVGQAVSAGIGYGAMAALGHAAIEECVRVRKSVAPDGTLRSIE